jgi:branched-chain amino acid transport system permease protein
VLVIITVIICQRLQDSRIGRAWMAIREDEIAAKAMGINTRNMKLLAFGMGATFGGVSGACSRPSRASCRPNPSA